MKHMKMPLLFTLVAILISQGQMLAAEGSESSGKTTDTYIEVVGDDPKAPTTFKAGERAHFKIRYHSATAQKVRIWVQPLTHGRYTPGGFYAPSAIEPQGPGEVDRFVGANDPAQVDEIRIAMVDADSNVKLAEATHRVNLKWEGSVPQPKNTAPVGQVFPGLKFTSIQGQDIDVSKMKGKVVLVDFWATWCRPCCGEMPQIVAAYDKYHADGLEIVGVSLDQSKEKLESYIQEHKMPWPQYFDGKGFANEIATRYAVTAIPCKFLIDRKGVVRYIYAYGEPLAQGLETLMKEGN